MPSNAIRALALAVASASFSGCADPVAKPVVPGSGSDRQLYEVRLGAAEGYRSHGVMLIEVGGGHLAVTVRATGLDRSQRIPQHIHVNPTCDPGGAILINLDAGLTVAGEGPGVGPAYPMSNRGGVVNYHASRPLTDLLAAVNAHAGAGLGSVEELLDWLDLEERNAHMHVSHGPPYPAVNCGEVRRIN